MAAQVLDKVTDPKALGLSLRFYFDFAMNKFVVNQKIKEEEKSTETLIPFADPGQLKNDRELLEAMYQVVGRKGKPLDEKFANGSVLLDSLKNNGALIFVMVNVDKTDENYGVSYGHRLIKEVPSFDFKGHSSTSEHFSDVFADYFMQYQTDLQDVPVQ